MKKVICTVAAFTVLFAAVSAYAQLTAATGPDNSPKIGAMAPDVPLPMNDAGAKSIKDFVGKKKVLLMFFPSAFTRGCTTEFTEAGQMHDKFVAANIEIIGISRDLQGALNAFKTSVGAKNTFVSDVELSVATAYDSVTPTRLAKRNYFLIDETGKVVWKSVSGTLIPTPKLLEDLAQVKSSN
jgi:peroxiredoxin